MTDDGTGGDGTHGRWMDPSSWMMEPGSWSPGSWSPGSWFMGPSMMGPWMMLLPLLVILAVAVGLVLFFRRPGLRRADTAWSLARPARALRGPGGTRPEEPERDRVLVMPDISGYTRFLTLTRFAQGHAEHIVSELLQALIEGAEPELIAAKVEGDAVLFHAPMAGPDRRDPAAVARALQRLFAAFYRRRAELQASNLCRCAACTHLDDLDLKAVVHRGPVSAYRLGSFTELAGMPVVVVHRLLKNTVGRPRYVLVTEDAADVVPPFGRGPEPLRQVCEGVGEIVCRVYGFEPDDAAPAADRAAADRRPLTDQLGKIGANLRALGRALRRPGAS